MQSNAARSDTESAMKCPACERVMEPMHVGDLEVDVCRGGCGGVWFDRFELDKVDEEHEAAGAALLDIPSDPSAKKADADRHMCPKCGDMPMMRHYFTVKREIEVDTCPGCAGVWLDAGELATVRAQFETESDRKEAADKAMADMFGSQLDAMRAESDAQAAKARKIAHALRFLCPSYYIPGKQKGAAF